MVKYTAHTFEANREQTNALRSKISYRIKSGKNSHNKNKSNIPKFFFKKFSVITP